MVTSPPGRTTRRDSGLLRHARLGSAKASQVMFLCPKYWQYIGFKHVECNEAQEPHLNTSCCKFKWETNGRTPVEVNS